MFSYKLLLHFGSLVKLKKLLNGKVIQLAEYHPETLISLTIMQPCIVDEQKAALDVPEFQGDPSGLKGRKSESTQKVERSLPAGQPPPVSTGLKSPAKTTAYRSNQETTITFAPKIVSTSVHIEKEPATSIPVPGQCDPTRPHSPHPTNCYIFYHCIQRIGYVEKVEKTCNPPTMFNPDTMICDWPESVRKIRPECGAPISATLTPMASSIDSSSTVVKAPAQPSPIKSAPLIAKTATCVPPCQNLGFCKASGECICPDIYEGPQCQFAKAQRCLQKPYTPVNSRVIYNDKEYLSTCNKGFAFPDGSKELRMVCDDGNWVQHHQPTGTIQKVPDCQPVCDPACINGGRCLSNNMCDCPQEFRGPQCNYPVKNCAPELMNFNGGYNCTIGSTLLRCSLKCGANGVFEFPPAAVYSCDFAKAKFTPETIPQCISASLQAQNLKSIPINQSQVLIEQSAGLKGNFQHSANHETEWYHPTTASPKIVSTHLEGKSPNPVRVPDRCDPTRPHSPHPTNCHLFYHCVNGIKGVVYLEKACQPSTMFNPNTMICDWPETVMSIRPCGVITVPSTKKLTTAGSCVDGWTDWVSVSTPAENAGDFELYEQMVPQDFICPSSSVHEIEHQVRFRCHCEDDASLPLVKISEPISAEKAAQVATTRKPTATEKVVLAPTTPAIAKKNLECPKGYSWSRCAYICTRLCSSYAAEVKKQGRCQTSNDLSCTPGCIEDDETMDLSCLWYDKYTCVPPTDCVAAPTQKIHQKG